MAHNCKNNLQCVKYKFSHEKKKKKNGVLIFLLMIEQRNIFSTTWMTGNWEVKYAIEIVLFCGNFSDK